MIPRLAPASSEARPLHLVEPDALDALLQTFGAEARNWVEDVGYGAKAGELCLLPGADGKCAGALFGLGAPSGRSRQRFGLAGVVASLPEGDWRIATPLEGRSAQEAALAWLLASYRFDRYAKQSKPAAALVAPDGVNAGRIEDIAASEFLVRDLINTPASDMGPSELEEAARALADEFGARMECITGNALLEQNFPMIHSVGRASPRSPRLLDLRWGGEGPRLTLVGKGVCFDTGGLNLKSGASMGLMKKDMGGAANALGLARMIMARALPVQLRVLIPAVENAVGGASFRPQDVLTSRSGLTVEINNTDAEGRLVLADAISLADEEKPDLLVSLATLTGAARVALGPDIAPFFTDDAAFASALEQAASDVRDPAWRLPFHPPYEAMIEPGIADLDNAPKGGFAGAITAALFLRRFVEKTERYAHFDIYGWQPSAAPGRPVGGAAQGIRALFEALPQILDIPSEAGH